MNDGIKVSVVLGRKEEERGERERGRWRSDAKKGMGDCPARSSRIK